MAMSLILGILGSLGGLCAFIGMMSLLVRAIARNIGATKENTSALTKLSAGVATIRAEFDDLKIRTAVLEDRWKRPTR